MRQAADNDELLTRYLLGELSDAEQEGVEQRYISEPEFYEQLLAVEDDLFDAYVEGSLGQSRLKSFENHFLRSPERQSRVGFAKAWMAYLERQAAPGQPTAGPTPRRSFVGFLRVERWPVALRVAAAVVVILAGGLLIAEILKLRIQIDQAESERVALEKTQRELQQQMDDERRHSQELSSQLERERQARDRPSLTTAPASSGIISMILSPGLIRGGGGAERLIIPPDARQVNLQLNFKHGEYESYIVAIETVEGRAIWSKTGLKAQSSGARKFVLIQAPAGLLTTEDYVITLSGVSGAGAPEEISRYSFGVTRK